MKRFASILRRLLPYKKWLGLSVFFNILMAIFTIGGIPLFIPFFELLFTEQALTMPEDATGIKADLMNLFGNLLLETDPQRAMTYIILLIILIFLLKNIFRYLGLFFLAPVRNAFIRDLRQDLFNHMIDLPVQFFKQNKKGDLLARMSMDIQETENSILNVIQTLIKSPLLILGSLAFMFYVSYELTLLVLFLIPFTVIVIGGISRSLKRQSAAAQQKLGELLSQLEEAVSGNKIIKSFNADSILKNKFSEKNEEHKHILTRLLWRKDLGSPLAEVLAVLLIAMLMYYSGQLVFQDKLSPDTFFAFIYAFFIIIEPAKSFSSAYYSYKKGDAALERLEAIFNVENPIKSRENALKLNSIQHEIEFREVSFAYPDQHGKVLDNINFKIKKGEKVAIVGASGAGKSTLVDLLPRFIDIDEGKILIDGISISDISLKDLRSLIAVVTQDSILFNDTIAANISFGKEDKNPGAIEEAIQIANLSDFIQGLEKGIYTRISDMGGNLSGGQKQRIAIARAVFKNAPLLILDEATSSLDSASEKKVQQALDNMLARKTALIIAHRLSTITGADKILVLKAGRIIEKGNHKELMNKRGEYYKFVQLQSLKKDWRE